MTYQNEIKRDLEKFEFFKANQAEILTVFDARLWGGDRAAVPGHLTHSPRVALLWGTNLPVPIPDLHANETGVSGTLSFSGGLYYCVIPWRRVYMLMSGGLGAIWPLDVPISVSLTDLEKDYGFRVERQVLGFDPGHELPPVREHAGLRALPGGRITPRPSARRPSSPRLRSIPCSPAPVQSLDDQFPDPPAPRRA